MGLTTGNWKMSARAVDKDSPRQSVGAGIQAQWMPSARYMSHQSGTGCRAAGPTQPFRRRRLYYVS
jgi:hypothetical protein